MVVNAQPSIAMTEDEPHSLIVVPDKPDKYSAFESIVSGLPSIQIVGFKPPKPFLKSCTILKRFPRIATFFRG